MAIIYLVEFLDPRWLGACPLFALSTLSRFFSWRYFEVGWLAISSHNDPNKTFRHLRLWL